MISLREFLLRFRRAWAPPGPALTRVAPPVDVHARLREEVKTLLEAIGTVQERARAITEEADARASEVLEEASRQAEAKLRDAEGRVAAARAEAAKKKREAFDQEIQSALDSARREVQRIDARSRERLPEIVQHVVDCVLQGPKETS